MPPTNLPKEFDAATTKHVEICRETSGKHVCMRAKGHDQQHRDGKGFTWLTGDVVANRASRVRPDGKCKNGHQVLIDGKPTDNAREYPKDSGKFRCKQCQRDYCKKNYRKDRRVLAVLDEAMEKVGLDGSWFDFKAKCNREKLEVIQTLGKLLDLPSLDPEVLDSLRAAPTVGLESPGNLQGEPDRTWAPGSNANPF